MLLDIIHRLILVNILDKDETMDNVQEHNMCTVLNDHLLINRDTNI
jgi:hypothetical protein